MEDFSFLKIVVTFIPLIIAVAVHEAAHGLAADKLGDNTARQLGRITLNPIKHIDPVLTILLPGMLILSGSPIIFGGAKPVPVNIYNLRNPKRDMALVAAAGPASNFILAGIGSVFLLALNNLLGVNFYWLIIFFVQWIFINIILAVFNLFPLPPLDGGRIMTGLLPRELAAPYARLERYGFIILILLLFTGVISQYLMPIIELILQYIDFLLAI